MIRLGVLADLPAATEVYRSASLSNADDRDNLLAHPEHLILRPEGLAEGRTYVAEEDGSLVGFATWIEAINASRTTVIAIDVPSGLDADSGVAYAPCVRANTTITLGLPKPGLLKLSEPVFVADIGVPFEAYAAVGVAVPADLFAKGELVRL